MDAGLVDIVTLADIGAGDRALVGGKGASLGELTGAGIRVPPAFVVTTGAFRRCLGQGNMLGAIATEIRRLDPGEPDRVADVTAAIRARIEATPLPTDLEAAIQEGYAALAGEPAGDPQPSRPAVAVRSSATGEDSAEASFAGLQDTYLWVRGDEVPAHVLRCWASLYSVESVTYRLRRGISEAGLAMAVVVQRMVDARTSGVMFTRSPRSGDRSVIVIEAAWGLGSAVVGGEVTPDGWVVNKVTGEVIRRTVSRKLRRHLLHPSGRGVVDDEVPDELKEVPSLSEAELGTVVDAGRVIERHYGTPQDIEWAMAGEEPAELYVLQSRPETVWAARSAEPVAGPAARDFDHVASLLGRPPQPPDGTPR